MFQRGGSEDDDIFRAAAVACALLGVLAVAAPWPLVRGRWPVVAALALAGLAAWTAVSVSWADIRFVAADDAGRLLLYTAAFSTALVAMRSPEVRRATPWALLVAIAAASVYGLATRLVPDVAPAEVFGSAGARLSHPITYWNGLGLLTGVGVLLGIACAAERHAPRAARAAAGALAVVCAFACYMTISRGAFVAVFAGLVVLALARPRRGTAVAAAAVLVPSGILALALQAFPAVRETPVKGAGDQISQGKVVAALVVGAAGLAALALALLLRPSVDRDERRLPFRIAAGLSVAAVAAILVATVAISYASEQSEELSTSTGRLAEAKTFRGPYWRVALGEFADHPLAGAGSGSFRVAWRQEADVPRGAVDAHSLYFETLGELGLVGGLLLALFLGAVVAGIVTAARARPGDPVIPGAAAAVAAFLVHAGVDWDWELPGVTLPVLLLAAAAMTPPEPTLDSAE
jgi:O-antigen ligase